MRRIATLFVTCCLGIAMAQSVRISHEGKSDYCIVVPDDAAPVLKVAADELASHLKEATGAEYPIFEEAKRPDGRPAFVIGPAKAAAKAFSDPSFSQGKPDEIAIRFKGADIYLNGQMPRGPLYATYTFLEDYVGVIWWSPEETHVPKLPTLEVPAKEHSYAPKLASREAFYKGTHNNVFATRMKNNGFYTRIKQERGGFAEIIGFCHTFRQFLPAEKYFADHPEWYSEINGKRNDKAQLCLTNEEMRAEMVKVCLERLRQNPTAKIISVSQNDRQGRCECAKCKALEAIDGTPSGPMIRFVNAVAEEIAKVYPDVYVHTLAYQYTRKAPKVTRPAKNVIICLCSIEMNFAEPLETGPSNASFRKDIEEWSAITSNILIWNYVTNFAQYMLPHPNWRGLAPDIRFFVKHNAIGIFDQGDAGCSVGDFVRPRQWIISKLLWNPDLDEKALTRKYFDGYYGAAAPHLLRYIDFICDTVEKSKYNLRCFTQDVFGWLSYEQLQEALAIYAQAEEAVKGDAVLAQRVRRERIPLDLVTLQYAIRLNKQQSFKKNVTLPSKNELLALADEFIELTKDAGRWRESAKMGNYAINLKESLELAYGDVTVPEICKGKPLDSWDCFPVASYRLHGEGTLAKQVQDPAANGGKAIQMPCDHFEWATDAGVPIEMYDSDKKWKIVARVRCEGDSNDGNALTFGIYGKGLFHYQRPVKVSECKGKEYAIIESDAFSIKELQGRETMIWFAPPKRPKSELQYVYIDDVILLRAE